MTLLLAASGKFLRRTFNQQFFPYQSKSPAGGTIE